MPSGLLLHPPLTICKKFIGANLFLLLASFHPDAAAPILLDGTPPAVMADPVPQALVLTAIVIGVGILALALSLVLKVQQAYGTLDIRELRRRLEQDIAAGAGVRLLISRQSPQAAGSARPAAEVAND